MAKMGKLTPEEEARNKMIMRERDRERKRVKRMNPEYRRMEQERDRDRKKARRSNEAFRQLEKLRDKIRKERKKGIIVDEAALAQQFNLVQPAPVEPEVIISDTLPSIDSPQNNVQQQHNNNSQQQQQQQQQINTQQQQQQQQQQNNIQQHITPQQRRRIPHSANSGNPNPGNIVNMVCAPTSSTTTTTLTSVNNNNMINLSTAAIGSNMTTSNPTAAHMTQLNKGGLLYPPPNFPHHPLPIPGVALMPSLCHPILHQNLSASLYPQNGIKQEYNPVENSGPSNNGHNNGQQSSSLGAGGGSNNNNDEHEMPMIEPEIILQTSSDVISAPHHFNNHAHAHHIHQQNMNMFSHMSPQAHMAAVHMRAHMGNAAVSGNIPPPSASALVAVAVAAHQQQQLSQQINPGAHPNAISQQQNAPPQNQTQQQ
ncbi:uncharacterized protein LOC142227036 [Haematobia irritans]|uniref:uncharacterized protein LOC142227036 n=1 Tax=Haematobia irritans TaxID=7368 RepID=UPI003F504835